MLATQVLSEDLSENVEKEDYIEEIVGYILINDSRYEIKTGETKIGRDSTMCSLVIENTTVSKVHAVIESEGIEDTFIYDAGSTNQTKLGKKTLKPHYRYKLENNSDITFGNITVKFLLPSNIVENSESKKESDLNTFKPPLVPEDIFDAVTQVTVPFHPQTSGKILQFGKEPENVQISNTPDLADYIEKPKESLGTSKDSITVTECQLDSKDLLPRTNCSNSFHDTSGIFSLSTQCQIIQPCSSKESKSQVSSDNHGDNKLDPVKDFLCDGQDDVLCTFMSLHSPGELSKQIKTEVQEDSQLFDIQMQVQVVFNQTNHQRNSLQLNKDFCSQNLTKPNTSSSQFDGITEINPVDVMSEKVSISTKDTEEDFIKTQMFIGHPPLEECRPSLLNRPVNEDIAQDSYTECYFEETIDLPTTEGPSENDDLICTQKFEVLPKDTTKSPPDNEELNDSNEDLMETQLYDFNKEQDDKESAGKPTVAPLVVSESPEKDSEPYMVDKTDFTQRNAEEDFISTQTFSKMTQNRNAGVSSSRTSGRLDDDFIDEEDFIATQPIDFLRSSIAKHKCFEEPIPIQTSSRESSPDLLDSEKKSKDITRKRPEASSSELLEKTDSLLLTSVKKELDGNINIYPVKSVERIESSGEETESDLEILFDKSNSSKKVLKIGEFGDICCNVEPQRSENSITARDSEAHENDSNSSYIFQVEPETHTSSPTPTEKNTPPDKEVPVRSDSDATDCEDVAVVEYKVPVELPGKISSDETQLQALTPPNIASSPDEDNKNDRDSPTFEMGNENECWSQLSLKMPDTQDMENTINKIRNDDGNAAAHDVDPRKEEDYQTPSKKLKTEVKIDTLGSSSFLGKQVESPLKRLGNNVSEVEAVPSKKSKIETSDRKLRSSEKQFLKLWQVHDIEQIQPYRTRSSLKNSAPENKSNKTDIFLGNNISNKFATSRRESRAKRRSVTKPSSDITQYLFKKAVNSSTSHEGRKKETSPKVELKPVECFHRVLRSSRRNSHNIFPNGSSEYSARQSSTRSTRNSRLKKDEYFGNSCVNVVFTGFDCESLEKIISNLGGKKTDDLSLGDVVVADKVRRTVKFLSAIALSLPITSPHWLAACRAEKKFLNPWDFILEDEESERKWGFELRAALTRSKNAKLMQGLNVYATEGAKPPVKDLMAIVKYCGGTPLFEPPNTWPKKTIIVSCPEDKKFWPPAKFRNVKIVHYEFILIGVLRQQLDYKAYKLR